MSYTAIPSEITFNDLNRMGSLSPSMYQKIVRVNGYSKKVRKLIEPSQKGVEVGGNAYVEDSDFKFIRTSALQEFSYLIIRDTRSILSVKPKAFINANMRQWQILYAKDSNIGECSILESSDYSKYMFSSGILKLSVKESPLYLFAFLKHPFLKEQVLKDVSKGATIRHSKLKILDCLIPFPKQKNGDEVVVHIEDLIKSIVDKEVLIRRKHGLILSLIDKELRDKQKPMPFHYESPKLKEIRQRGRLDTSLYTEQFKRLWHRIVNYADGYDSILKLGYTPVRGPNLAISEIGRSIYTETPLKGFYELIRPTNITEWGTLVKKEYLGNKRELQLVNKGAIIIGCEGYEKGRSLVLLDDMNRCTTNFHATALTKEDSKVIDVVFVRCFLAYLREIGMVDMIGVGGSGGHFAPEYFDLVLVPNFPENVKERVARLYHNPNAQSDQEQQGIYQLNADILNTKQELWRIQEKIIRGSEVSL